MANVLRQIIKEALAEGVKSPKVLRKIKGRVVKEHGIKDMPSDVELLAEYKRNLEFKIKNEELLKLLKTREIRTLSGVAVVAVLTKPYPCPGNCLYCPNEPGMPKSYLSNEPAVMRAVRCRFDPYKQIQFRLKALANNGHETDKCELIVMGGTWSYLPKRYQSWFLKRCYDGFNDFKAKNSEEAKKRNEKAKHRVIGLTLETRQDYITKEEVERMRKMGATRVELGVQAVDDKILRLNRRGHTTQKTIEATKLLREAGFKITYHLMPNLPGSTPAKDLKMFKIIFADPRFQPDQIKIYPCVVTKDSDLYKLWKAGKYKSYTDEQLKDLLIKIKKIVPPWVRIARLIRDIPGESIVAGNKITNLRQILKQEKAKCSCLRCREPRGDYTEIKNSKFKIKNYPVINGQEYFLTFQDRKYTYAFCRLHLGQKAIIRELHTYGQMTPLKKKGEVQHLGFGKKLLSKAEELAKKQGYAKIYVISGVGAREYYRRQGYRLEDDYMVKKLF